MNSNEIKKIKLNNTDNEYVLVDAEDYEFLSKYVWTKIDGRNTFYANNKELGKMHRVILDAKDNQLVDHINHNGLDNQRHNLRLATQSQNKMNSEKHKKGTSIYKGVHKNSKGAWIGQIKTTIQEESTNYLGTFPTEEIAAVIYNYKAKNLFGEFACLNILNLSDELQQDIVERWKNGDFINKSSVHEGVTYLKREKCFLAYVSENKMQYPLGYFDEEDEAGRVVSSYYDSPINSSVMKTKALHFWRFVRKNYICATEVGKFNSDVMCSDGSTIIETEIKISEQDLKREFEKEKHKKYLSPYVNRSHEIPNKYYLMVPIHLKDTALELIADKPYGLLCVDSRKISNKKRKTFTEVIKPASQLTSRYCEKLHRKIILRMSSELVQGHIKLFIEKDKK